MRLEIGQGIQYSEYRHIHLRLCYELASYKGRFFDTQASASVQGFSFPKEMT